MLNSLATFFIEYEILPTPKRISPDFVLESCKSMKCSVTSKLSSTFLINFTYIYITGSGTRSVNN